MTEQEFEAQLRTDGFDEIDTRELPAKAENNPHVHDWSVRGLVLDGAFIVRLDGRQVRYERGDVFAVAEGIEHTEETGNNGARILIGKKF